jgi:hypothetical protein
MRVGRLALALFVLGVLADDANYAATMNDFALIADLLYGRTDLHNTPKSSRSLHSPQLLAKGSADTALHCLIQLEAKS